MWSNVRQTSQLTDRLLDDEARDENWLGLAQAVNSIDCLGLGGL
jgi:hypothetical protein